MKAKLYDGRILLATFYEERNYLCRTVFSGAKLFTTVSVVFVHTYSIERCTKPLMGLYLDLRGSNYQKLTVQWEWDRELELCETTPPFWFSDMVTHVHSATKWRTTHSRWMHSRKTSKILLEVTGIILWHRNTCCETEWIYIQDKMKGSIFFDLVWKQWRTWRTIAHFLHTWFIISVAFPMMFLCLLDRKSYKDFIM